MRLMSSPSPIESPARPSALSSRRISKPAVLALLISAAYLGILYFRVPLSNSDEGIIAAGAERILRGQVPFRDFFSELGPGAFFLQAIIFKLAGSNLAALRWTVLVIGVALTALTYALGRDLIPNSWSLLPPILFAALCYPYAYLLSSHWWAHSFYLAGVFFLARDLGPRRNTGHSSRLIIASALMSLAALSLQPTGVAGLAAGLIFIWFEPYVQSSSQIWPARGQRVASCLKFVLGGAIPLAMAFGYFAAHGALSAWIYDNWVFPITRYRPYLNVPSASVGPFLKVAWGMALQSPSRKAVLVALGYTFFSIVLPALAIGGSTWVLVRARRRDSDCRLMLLYFLMAVGGFLAELHSPDIVHFLFSAPLMLIVGLFVLKEAWTRWRILIAPLALLAMMGVVLLGIAVVRRARYALAGRTPVITRRGTLYLQQEQASDWSIWINTIQACVPAGGETFFFPYDAKFFYLTATMNPTRFDVLLPEFHTKHEIEEVISQLRRNGPATIFSFDEIERRTVRPQFPNAGPDITQMHPVEAFLRGPESPYRLVEDADGMEVWTLKK